MTTKEMMEEMLYENYPTVHEDINEARYNDGCATILKKHVKAVYDVYITTDWYQDFLNRERELV